MNCNNLTSLISNPLYNDILQPLFGLDGYLYR